MSLKNKLPLAIVFALAAALPACRKKNPAPPPSLSPMPTLAGGAAKGGLKADREVSARKEAVKLTLRVYKTKLRRDESLWAQVEITNIAQGPFLVHDDMFYEPLPLADAEKRRFGVRIHLEDAAGVQLKRDPPGCLGTVVLPEDPSAPLSPLQEDLAEQSEFQRKMEAQGLPRDEQTRRLIDFVQKQGARHQEEVERWKYKRLRMLEPGRTMTSVPFAEDRGFICRPDGPGTPLGPYSEISTDYYHLKPGHYRLRAVYDYLFMRDMNARLSRRTKSRLHPGASSADIAALYAFRDAALGMSVRVETPSIEFEVLP